MNAERTKIVLRERGWEGECGTKNKRLSMRREKKKFIIDRLPKRFNEGMFWGNSQMGSLLYVRENQACFAIDHEQLWETRDSWEDTPKGTFKDFIENPEKFFDGTYFNNPVKGTNYWRTKLPGLSFSIAFEEEITGFYGELDYETAVSNVIFTLKNNKKIQCIIYLDSNINLFNITLNNINFNEIKDSNSLPMQSSGQIKDRGNCKFQIRAAGWDTSKGNLSVLKEWGYPEYQTKQNGEISCILQPYSENGIAALSCCAQENNIYVTLQAVMDTKTKSLNAVAAELEEKNSALICRYQKEKDVFWEQHKKSWASYWEKADVTVPNERLQQAYDAEMYKIFSNERENGLPVTLQGIWNNDLRMPAWCGDLHNDMNVQACYWPVYKNNHAELGAAYIDYYTSIMPRLMERAYKLFGISNAIHCPVMMAPGGYGAGGEWCFWNCLLGPELFVAADFVWYYEFSRDDKRLASSIYPFLERVIHLYQGIAYQKEDEYLHIPFTNSPEVFKDGRMLIRDDATIVISTLHYVLDHLAVYAVKLGKGGTDFKEFNEKLVPVVKGEKGYPLFPGEDIFESHRHFCQMFPVFPLGTDIHSDCAARSLNAVVDKGYTEYASWSFPYLSIFASRCGRGNMAAMLLELYCLVFRSRNTFCANGDPNWCGVLRVADTNAGEPSDTFTLEAGFIMAAAVSEMFVHRSKNEVYLAYGIPKEWKNASCCGMVIEGGHKISMELENYRVKCIRIEAGKTEQLNFHIADYGNFEGKENQEVSSAFLVAKEKGEENILNIGQIAEKACVLCLESGKIYQIKEE